MKRSVFYFLLCVLLVGKANAQNQSNRSDANSRYSAALEDQIGCKQEPNPAKAIRALQQATIIEKTHYLNFDSISYFKAKQPITAWGLRISSVFGFAPDARVFQRGPGTAPPITIGILVPYSVVTVKAKLKELGLSNMHIQKAEFDANGRAIKSNKFTEISCSSDK